MKRLLLIESDDAERLDTFVVAVSTVDADVEVSPVKRKHLTLFTVEEEGVLSLHSLTLRAELAFARDEMGFSDDSPPNVVVTPALRYAIEKHCGDGSPPDPSGWLPSEWIYDYLEAHPEILKGA